MKAINIVMTRAVLSMTLAFHGSLVTTELATTSCVTAMFYSGQCICQKNECEHNNHEHH